MYNNKKKKKSGLQKTIMVFVWIMIILTLGSVLYAPLAQLLGAG
ncbi:DUF4044 domain-containing protein [Pediococcus stilesii]|uniref:DUF4044 domain-containing protein n=1 Tax=Pediococcus stilesii TaxID=331679 RepID=A0A5R9BWH8_9LACO|nr:DUF4044 domain-containing protein [Pediococcus stilesii]TLQ05009.1 DUF4044 domain-containing protein [Pediococcus stilesii]